MRTPSPDGLIEFIRKRGEGGVTMSELTWEFLRPASASPALCERILRGVLGSDPRVREMSDGRWAALLDEARAPMSGYTIIEVSEAFVAGRGRVEIEVAVCRARPSGARDSTTVFTIQPQVPPDGLLLPPDLRRRMASAVPRGDAVAKIAELGKGSVLVCYRLNPFVADVRRRLIDGGTPTPVLQLQRLARSLLGKDGARSPEATAAVLLQMEPEIHSAEDRERVSADLLSAFLDRGHGEAEELLAAQHPTRHEVDFDDYAFDREDLAGLPTDPGIYVMRDVNGDPVYVGKARNLRQRVSSYFRSRIERDQRVQAILDGVHSLETESAGSELEALLMEYRAIRDLSPYVNLQFDVHERHAAKQAEMRRIIAVLPSVRPRCVELFMVRGAEALRQVRLSARWGRRAAAEIRRFFFEAPGEPEGDVAETQIFWSWYTRRRDSVHVVDVDAAAGADDVIRLTRELHGDVLKGGERIFRV
jgi:hypothetical protein